MDWRSLFHRHSTAKPRTYGASQPEGQWSKALSFLSHQSAVGASNPVDVAGFGRVRLQINNAGSSTVDVLIEGSHDRTVWFACGYKLKNTATPARAITAISMLGTSNVPVEIDDYYPWLRVTSSNKGAGTLDLSVSGEAVPV
jgi:hypothetical protein